MTNQNIFLWRIFCCIFNFNVMHSISFHGDYSMLRPQIDLRREKRVYTLLTGTELDTCQTNKKFQARFLNSIIGANPLHYFKNNAINNYQLYMEIQNLNFLYSMLCWSILYALSIHTYVYLQVNSVSDQGLMTSLVWTLQQQVRYTCGGGGGSSPPGSVSTDSHHAALAVGMRRAWRRPGGVLDYSHSGCTDAELDRVSRLTLTVPSDALTFT